MPKRSSACEPLRRSLPHVGLEGSVTFTQQGYLLSGLGISEPDPLDALQCPSDLPDDFPVEVAPFKALAVRFCRVFGGCKTPEALKKHGPLYADALAMMRSRGVSPQSAWAAFGQALAMQNGKPLFGGQAKKALAYLEGRSKPSWSNQSRTDSCGCPLPRGVALPRLLPGETAHWDGDEFIFGSDRDPRRTR